jgi:27-O-demethylrifamycin SV methyltransferase
MPARMLVTTWRERGPAGCARTLSAATRMALPLLLRGRRTASGVAGYFDLITDEGRLFYGDSFHFGHFRNGSETLAQALDAHTDLVARMARPIRGGQILDVGCGIGAPAIRIATQYGCRVTAVNISREQVRQGRQLIDERRMSERVTIQWGDARELDFPDASFDGIVCLEAAGDICVSESDKDRLVRELHRLLRPGGHVGFSDLALHTCPPAEHDRALRAVLYHRGAELVTDWPSLFRRHGFSIVASRDIIGTAIATWNHTRALYDQRRVEMARRYGSRVAHRTRSHIERIAEILADYATFPVLSARR